MKKAAIAIALALAVCTAVAHAQQQIGFFGLRLGEPPSLPRCVSSLADREMPGDPGPCVQTAPRTDVEVDQHLARIPSRLKPDWMKAGIFVYTSVGGSVEVISISTKGAAAQHDVLRVLREKFGAGDHSKSAVKTRVGVEYERLSEKWSFDGVEVIFDGFSSSIDMGTISATTGRGRGALEAAREKREAGKAKL